MAAVRELLAKGLTPTMRLWTVRITSAVAVGWFVLLAGRRALLRSVEGREVGVPAPTPTIPRAIQIAGDLDSDAVWRGPAPPLGSYAELADGGATHVVDLRSEIDPLLLEPLLADLGLTLVHIPIDNGRSPRPGDLDLLRTALRQSGGACYVHCEAGEGRTGAILGAYFVDEGVPTAEVLCDALAIGDLTFSQMTYVASGGRAYLAASVVDWLIDRPTEALLGLTIR